MDNASLPESVSQGRALRRAASRPAFRRCRRSDRLRQADGPVWF